MAQEPAPPDVMEAVKVAQMMGPRYGVDAKTMYDRMHNWWTRGLIHHWTPTKRRRPVYVQPAEIEDMMRLRLRAPAVSYAEPDELQRNGRSD